MRQMSCNYDTSMIKLCQNIYKQECIPVGCVSSAAVAVSGGVSAPGGCLVLGGSALEGCLLPGGVSGHGGCLLQGGVCSRGCLVLGEVCVCSGGVCLLRGYLVLGGVCSRGVFASGGCLLLGRGGLLPGVCVCSGGCGIPACTEADILIPPVDRHTPVKT